MSSLVIKNKMWIIPEKSATQDTFMSEEWLQIQAAQQDPAAFRPLYDRYYTSIFHFIHRRTADETLSADICSQVFLKAMQNLGKYQHRGLPFFAWLFRIAANEVTNYFRQHQKARAVTVADDFWKTLSDDDETTENTMEDYLPMLTEALNNLKETELELIEMRYFEQRSFKEIAEIVGITETNAKVKTYRLLDKIKQKIQQILIK